MTTVPSILPETLIAILLIVKAAHPDSNRDLAACARVSLDWNDCSPPILYRDIKVVWASKVGKRLIRTIEGDRALALLVHSLSIDYLRIEFWVDLAHFAKVKHKLQWDWSIQSLPPDRREHDSRGGGAREGFTLRLHPREDRSAKMLAWRSESEGENGEWMDGGPVDDVPREAGAKALSALAGRLELGTFEFYRDHFPLSHSLEHLVYRLGQAQNDSSRHVTLILEHTPNLQELNVRSPCSDIAVLPSTTLSALHINRHSNYSTFGPPKRPSSTASSPSPARRSARYTSTSQSGAPYSTTP